jgi:hypothetical protein
VSHLTWNSSRQCAAVAVSQLQVNELVTTLNIAVVRYYVGLELRGTLCIKNPIELRGTLCIKNPIELRGTLSIKNPIELRGTLCIKNPIELRGDTLYKESYVKNIKILNHGWSHSCGNAKNTWEWAVEIIIMSEGFNLREEQSICPVAYFDEFETPT